MAGSKTIGELSRCGEKYSTLQVDFVADASAGTVPDADLTDGRIIGKLLKSLEVVPGSGAAEPGGVFTVKVENSRGLALLTDTDNAVDAVGFVQPTADIVINTPLTITVTDLGNSNGASAILTFE